MTSPSLPLISENLTIVSDTFPVPNEARFFSETILVDGQPRTLAEVVDHEVLGYRAWGTPAGDFLARQMERLAQLIRWMGASDPAEHEARMEVWDQEIREQWFDRGYHEGREARRRESGRGDRPAWD
jgi:hypothetical protein